MLRGKNVIPSLEKLILAALLQHSGLWKKIDTVMYNEVTPEISSLWRYFLKFRNWMRQERQAYIRKEKENLVKTPLIQGISEHASISPGKKDKTNSKSINDFVPFIHS